MIIKWKTHLLFISLLVMVGVVTQGCASFEKNSKLDALELSLNDFRKAIRWGYYESAAQHIRQKKYDKPLHDPTYLKNIRITSYEYGVRQFSEDGNRVTVTAHISYYDVDRGTVHSTSEKQNWWFDPESKRWFLDGDIPDLKI